MQKIILSIIFAFLIINKSIELNSINWNQLPVDILKNEILRNILLKEIIEKIKLATTLPELYNAIKVLRHFAYTSKKDLQIFIDLVEEKQDQLSKKSLREVFVLKKNEIIQEILIKLRKLPFSFLWFNNINSKNCLNNRTALMFSAIKGHKETVEYLLKNGADTKTKDMNGMSALDYAIKFDHKEIIELLKSA